MIVADDDQEPLREQQQLQQQHHAEAEHGTLDVSISIITAFDDANAIRKRAQVALLRIFPNTRFFPDI